MMQLNGAWQNSEKQNEDDCSRGKSDQAPHDALTFGIVQAPLITIGLIVSEQ
jgi:hypothetical protein